MIARLQHGWMRVRQRALPSAVTNNVVVRIKRVIASNPDLPVRERLLVAAEQQIAEYGVHGASIRSINAAAGANSAAAHYHFGSKEAIVRAVLDARMHHLTVARLALVDELRAGAPLSVELMARALVDPLVDLSTQDEGRSWIGFLSALQHAGPPWHTMAVGQYDDQAEPIWEALDGALPGLERHQRRLRWRLAGHLVARALTDPRPYWDGRVPDRSEIRSELVKIVTGILSSA